MKKVLCTVLAVLVLTMMCTTAFAAEISSAKTDNTLTVTVTGLSGAEESTLLVVDAGTQLSAVADDTAKIFYVDQVTASSEGTASYSFDVTNAGSIDIYSGYSSMEAGAQPLSIIAQEGDADADADADADFTYGDVNNDIKVNALDAGLVIDKFIKNAEFIDVNTNEVYANGAKAADVNADTSVNALDAGLIVDKFIKGVAFPVETAQ